jgi:hypothetical protein
MADLLWNTSSFHNPAHLQEFREGVVFASLPAREF